MKQNKLLITCILAATASFAPRLMADYPIASHRYLADPSPLVTNDRVYIYCSDDDESPVNVDYWKFE
jgi:arabinoxylan arabinofuranohydrolase